MPVPNRCGRKCGSHERKQYRDFFFTEQMSASSIFYSTECTWVCNTVHPKRTQEQKTTITMSHSLWSAFGKEIYKKRKSLAPSMNMYQEEKLSTSSSWYDWCRFSPLLLYLGTVHSMHSTRRLERRNSVGLAFLLRWKSIEHLLEQAGKTSHINQPCPQPSPVRTCTVYHL